VDYHFFYAEVRGYIISLIETHHAKLPHAVVDGCRVDFRKRSVENQPVRARVGDISTDACQQGRPGIRCFVKIL